AEESQQVVDQLSLGGVARDRGFEDVEITDLLYSAHGILGFEAVNRGLDRGIGRPVLFRKGFLNFSDGGAAARPQGVHDLELELCQLGLGHSVSSPTGVCITTTHVVFVSSDFCTLR